MLDIVWFTNAHEYRNHFFRLGFDQLARRGRVRLSRHPVDRGADYGLPAAFVCNNWRHASVLQVSDGRGRRIRVLIDNEDGFVHLHPLIEQVDLYFCVPYVSAFHERKEFITPFPWQTENDVSEYRLKAGEIISRFGDHFGKVRRLCPTPTALSPSHSPSPPKSRLARKLANARHKIGKNFRARLGIAEPVLEVGGWESRWNELMSMRGGTIEYDIVSCESLWGWPSHRIRLHDRLRSLSTRFKIHHQLTPVGPTDPAAGLLETLSADERELYLELAKSVASPQPMRFEHSITHSRLAVFPTGYHWGWRGITFVCLAAGGPILMDRPVYEPYFDLGELQIFYNDGTDWGQLEGLLESIDEPRWRSIRDHNCRAFDRLLSPSAAAEYMVGVIERHMGSPR